MHHDFTQHAWSHETETELKKLLAIAVWEDNQTLGDLTSRALVPESAHGKAAIVVRENGVVAGLAAVPTILAAVDPKLHWIPRCPDGSMVHRGHTVGEISGPARSLLTAERIALNLLGRLSGIATLTHRFADAILGTSAKIYDTRKTTLGWRRLEKFAVHCGGGRNHRTGLFDAVLIKDNHLAFGQENGKFNPAEAVRKARQFLHGLGMMHEIVEVEVDSLDQLRTVLPAGPDIVLLDNMNAATLKEAVEIRNELKNSAELEASGGVNLSTVRGIAESGVERISVGALTHSAIALDIGLDWL